MMRSQFIAFKAVPGSVVHGGLSGENATMVRMLESGWRDSACRRCGEFCLSCLGLLAWSSRLICAIFRSLLQLILR
jgi:hypothetical protein